MGRCKEVGLFFLASVVAVAALAINCNGDESRVTSCSQLAYDAGVYFSDAS